MNPKLGLVEENVEAVRKVVSGQEKADLVIFPELFLSGYTVESLDELALDLQGTEIADIASAAREYSTAVIVGAPERADGGYANSAVCIDRGGSIVGVYRKSNLYGDECTAFLAGDELLIVDLDGLKVGVLVCFDVDFPEVARSLARAGAELLVTISANMEPFGHDHEIFCTARALENGVPHIYVNQVGRGEKFTFTGGTFIASADGDRLVEAGPSGEKVISFGLNPPAKSGVRPDYLGQLRSPLPVTTAIEAKRKANLM